VGARTEGSDIVLVVLVLAGLAVLAAVVAIAVGRGGELSEARPDVPPLQMPTGRRLTGSDVRYLHLPHGLWGYQTEIADEALHRLAYALDERDARLAELERELAELRRRCAGAAREGREGPAEEARPTARPDEEEEIGTEPTPPDGPGPLSSPFAERPVEEESR